MRLDVFLKTARLVKRRSQAKGLCDAGRVWVNGRPAKAGQQIREGNRIALDLSRAHTEIEVEEVRTGLGGRRGGGSVRYKVLAERSHRSPLPL